MQFHHLVARERRLVLRIEQIDAVGQPVAIGLDDAAYLVDGVDDVGVRPLAHVDRDGVLAVDPGVADAVLEGAADVRDIVERHHGIAVGLDRKVENVARILDDARHLDGHAARAGIQRPRRHQPVVAHHGAQELLAADFVGLHRGGIDHHFEKLLAVALKLGIENVGNRLDVVANALREVVDHALLHAVVAHEVDLDDGEAGGGQFEDGGLLGAGRKPGLRAIHGGAHVVERFVQVVGGVELDGHPSHALIGVGAHLLGAFDRPQLHLERFHEQSLGVFRRDALVRHGDHEDRHLDVRIRLDRDADAGRDAGEDHHRHQQQRRPRSADRGVDDRVDHDEPAAESPDIGVAVLPLAITAGLPTLSAGPDACICTATRSPATTNS